MRTTIGAILILLGGFFVITSWTYPLVMGVLIVGGGFLFVRSGVTGKKLLSGEMRPPKQLGS